MKMKFVITTMIVGKKSYVVHELMSKQEGKKVVSYNPNISDALEFDTKGEAQTFADNINNPFDRIFKIENN
jgi:hypothetical protein